MHKTWALLSGEGTAPRESQVSDLIEEIEMGCEVILRTIEHIRLGWKRAEVWLMGNEHETTMERMLLSEKVDLFYMFVLLSDLGVTPEEVPKSVCRKVRRIFDGKNIEAIAPAFAETFLVALLRGTESPILSGYVLQHRGTDRAIAYFLEMIEGCRKRTEYFVKAKQRGQHKVLTFFDGCHYETTVEQAILRNLLDIAAYAAKLEKLGHCSDVLSEAIRECKPVFEDSPELQQVFPTSQLEGRK
jgi:hypothetical protein